MRTKRRWPWKSGVIGRTRRTSATTRFCSGLTSISRRRDADPGQRSGRRRARTPARTSRSSATPPTAMNSARKNERADDAPEQRPVPVGARDGEVAEDDGEHEQVVEREACARSGSRPGTRGRRSPPSTAQTGEGEARGRARAKRDSSATAWRTPTSLGPAVEDEQVEEQQRRSVAPARAPATTTTASSSRDLLCLVVEGLSGPLGRALRALGRVDGTPRGIRPFAPFFRCAPLTGLRS